MAGLVKKRKPSSHDYDPHDGDYVKNPYNYNDEYVDKLLSRKDRSRDDIDNILDDVPIHGEITAREAPQAQGDEIDAILNDEHPMDQEQPREIPDRPKEAFLQGFGQAGTLGYLPHLQAATYPAMEKAFGLVTGKHVDPDTSTYVERRDENIKRDSDLAKSNPKSYAGGAVAETALELPVQGPLSVSKYLSKVPGVGKALSKSGLVKGIVDAGAQGLAFNPGDKEGEISPLQWNDRAINSKDSAEFGAKFGLGVKALQAGAKGLSKVPGTLKNVSDNMALRGAGYMLRDRRRIKSMKPEIAETIYKENLLPVGGSTKDVAERAGKMVDDAGQKLDDAYLELDTAKEAVKRGEVPGVKKKDLRGFHPRKQADEIEQKIREELADDPDRERAVKKVMDWVDQTAEDYPKGVPPSDARRLKKVADDKFKFNKTPDRRDKTAAQKAFLVVANHIRDKIDEQAVKSKKVVSPKTAETLQKENKRMRRALDIRDTAQDKVLRDESNHPIGLINTIAASNLAKNIGLGAAGAGAGAYTNYTENPDDIAGTLIMAGALAGAGVGARKYGPGLVGRGSRYGSMVTQPLKKLQKAGEASGHGLIRGAAKIDKTLDKK